MDGQSTTTVDKMSTLDELVAARRREAQERATQAAAQDEATRQAREKRALDGARRWIEERPAFAAACGFVSGTATVKVAAQAREQRVEVDVRGRALLGGREVEANLGLKLNGDTGQWWQRGARLYFAFDDETAGTDIEEHVADGEALRRAAAAADTLLERLAQVKERLAREAAGEAATLERGRRGAAVVKRLAQEHLDICRSRDAAVMAWAHEWAAQWKPWSGWLVRYAPIGAPAGEGNIETRLILDSLNDVVTESPGASVRAVEWDGTVREMVIGAFLDATPVEFEAHDLRRGMEYHRQVRTYLLDGPAYGEPMVINVPPGAKWSPPAPPVKPPDWHDYVHERTGRDGFGDAANLVDIDEETLAGWYRVQDFADVVL